MQFSRIIYSSLVQLVPDFLGILIFLLGFQILVLCTRQQMYDVVYVNE